MNKNICKKCKNKLVVQTHKENEYEFFHHFKLICFDGDKKIFEKHLDSEFNDSILRDFFVNGIHEACDLFGFSNIEPDKNCPYYVEHMMIDEYNKKKDT